MSSHAASPRRIANLGMYDEGEVARANDALWDNMAERLRGRGMKDVPASLTRTSRLECVWSDPDLLFGQACGYPLATRFRSSLRALAAPVYDVPGCEGINHCSFVVVGAHVSATRLDDLDGARAVINDPESNSGRHLLGDALASGGLSFSRVTVSGGHAHSLATVAHGRADVAAIDCVSYAHLARAFPGLMERTRVLGRTRPAPAPPFVMSLRGGEFAKILLLQVLNEALADPRTAWAREVMRLVRVEPVEADAYECTRAVAARADAVFACDAASRCAP